ncbi:sialate O-acetylesterase [Serratia fonticola]
MSRIIDKPVWDEVSMLTRQDRVEGGRTGASNKQASQLANRTRKLKEDLESMSDYREYTFFTTEQDPDGTGAGIAGTEIGKMFRVAVKDGDGVTVIFNYYKNTDGAAEYINSEPNVGLVNAIAKKVAELLHENERQGIHSSYAPILSENEEFIYALTDTVGKLLSGVSNDEVHRFFTDISVLSNKRAMFEVNGNSVRILENQEILQTNDFAEVTTDKENRAIYAVEHNGDFSVYSNFSVTGNGTEKAISVSNGVTTVAGQQTFSTDEYAWGICDNDFRVMIGATHDGKGVGLLEGIGRSVPVEKFNPILAEQNHVSVGGQSLSTSTASGTPITTGSISGCIQPNMGVADGVHSAGEMVGTMPISTGLSTMTADINPAKREFPTYGICNQLKFMMNNGGENQYEILGSNNGHGAYRVDQLDKEGNGSGPTTNYQLGVNQARAYQRYASELGKSFLTQAQVWIQGESDISAGTSKAEYKRRLSNLLDDYHADIEQDYKPCMVTYQTSSHTIRSPNHSPDIAYGQLEIANENPFFFLACSTYLFPYNSDGVHMPANSYRWLGCYIGKALHRILTGKGWKPLQPEYISRNGRVVLIDFHVPSPPLLFDTSRVSDPGNYGFQVFNEDGSKELSIQSVSIVNDTQVKIVLNSAPAQPIRIKYALGLTGSKAGPTTGARGNLRDSDNAIAYENNTLTNQPYELFNWCVIFDRKEGETWV